MSDALHFDAHAAGAAGDRAHGGIQVGGGEVGLLGLGDLLGLRARELAHLVGVRRRAALVELERLRISTDAGGDLRMNVKLLSAYAVITTGSIRPGSIFCVWALNALQNSMMFRPRWPSAGPMGGEGFALPAGT